MAVRNWPKLKGEWLISSLTLEAFAKKKRIPISTVRQQAAKYRWYVSRTELERKTEVKVQEEAASRVAKKTVDDLTVVQSIITVAMSSLVKRQFDPVTGKESLVLAKEFRSAGEAVAAAITAIKTKRLIKGLPTDNLNISDPEQVLKAARAIVKAEARRAA